VTVTSTHFNISQTVFRLYLENGKSHSSGNVSEMVPEFNSASNAVNRDALRPLVSEIFASCLFLETNFTRPVKFNYFRLSQTTGNDVFQLRMVEFPIQCQGSRTLALTVWPVPL
jgi:hypothetical protein